MSWIKIVFFYGVLSFCFCPDCWAQGEGGGVWLEDNAFCIGNIVYDNLAKDGFGVAGRNGVLINCSVADNKLLAEMDYFPKPGDIYCADGEVVSIDMYKDRAVKDAIGVVFWVNADQTVDYPRGAVLSLNGQEEKKWGSNVLWICGDYAQDEDRVVQPLRDTSCYTHTKKMYDRYEAGDHDFEAGYACWTYRFPGQPDDIRWCMPTLTYLRRLYLMKVNIRSTFSYLRTEHPSWEIEDLQDTGERLYYWSVDDRSNATDAGFAFCVNMKSGKVASKGGSNPSNAGDKANTNWVRPIFIY